MKKVTVIGIIGNTQGVNKAIKPPKKANIAIPHNDSAQSGVSDSVRSACALTNFFSSADRAYPAGPLVAWSYSDISMILRSVKLLFIRA